MWLKSGLKAKFILMLLLILSFPVSIRASETVMGIGKTCFKDDLVKAEDMAKNLALEDAMLRLINLVTPYPQDIVSQLNPFDFINEYRIVDENESSNVCQIQVEIKPYWARLALFLQKRGILHIGDKDKILIFLDLPDDIDIKAQTLSFLKKFFLLFNLTPVYDEALKAEKIEDFLLDQGIPLLFYLSVKINTEANNSEGCLLQFDAELMDSISQETIYQTHLKPYLKRAEIEDILQFSLAKIQQIGYHIVPSLSSWLNKRTNKFCSFHVVLRQPSGYKDIFDVWQRLLKIEGISNLYPEELSNKKITYEGEFLGSISELINQLVELGFSVKLRGHVIELSRISE